MQSAILDRFRSEQQNILRFVQHLHSTTPLIHQHFREILNILRENGVGSLHREIAGKRRRISDKKIPELLSKLDELEPALRKEIANRKVRLGDEPKSPPNLNQYDCQLVYEWESYLSDVVEVGTPDADICVLRERLVAQAVEQSLDESDADPSNIPQIVDCALARVRHRKAAHAIISLEHALWLFDELRLIARMTLPSAEINFLRQGFILLMTAFDAAIFDLLRSALNRNFFGLIPKFAKEGTFKWKDMAKLNNFSEFTDHVIETQLKSRYIKDLLIFLSSIGVELFDKSTGDNFAMLFELVLRRNVHVHNRGYVDERYLERDENDKHRWNIDGLNLGDIAAINNKYWERTIRLTTFCVNSVAEWDHRGAGFTEHGGNAVSPVPK